MNNLKREEILLLFDVDGTLTFPRSVVEPEFEEFFYTHIKPRATIGIVGGAHLDRICEQMKGRKILEHFDFIFPENGTVQIANGHEVGKQSIQQHLGEETIKRFVNFVLRYLANLDLPIKRGTFLDFRNGMMNICPVGSQCSKEDRKIFIEFDQKHQIRTKMIEDLKQEFPDIDLTYSIGGQISFDIYPHGWDKTFCLNYITNNYSFKEIHFFGDKADPGGNDYEMFIDPRVEAHRVNTPNDTKDILVKMFDINLSK